VEPDAPFEILLDVQAHDLQLDRLQHRRETLPERAAVQQAQAAAAALDAQRAATAAQAKELTKEQTRREDEIASLEEKVARDERLLYGGTVSNVRELQALQDDVAGMKRRVSSLEDATLEIIDQLEPVEAELASLDERLDEAHRQEESCQAELAAAEKVIDAEIAEVDAERDALVPGVPAELLAEYARLRGRFGGIGAARLVGSRCDGCQLTLAAAEVERVKRADPGSVVHCEECGRILVR
jgi:predicted  nucleic acid-binding Zn-ribbon protein